MSLKVSTCLVGQGLSCCRLMTLKSAHRPTAAPMTEYVSRFVVDRRSAFGIFIFFLLPSAHLDVFAIVRRWFGCAKVAQPFGLQVERAVVMNE